MVKPVLVFTVDGGPDENPRYKNVIRVAVHHFKKHDLDAIFIATNAPGRSAFNRVERKMAPLSKELSGLILPHDHFGSHLDDRGNTKDVGLEKKNFQFAGETLAEIWSQLVVDGHPILAEYIDSSDRSQLSEEELLTGGQNWYDRHLRSSQYMTQIVKCEDSKCCSSPRSSYFNVLPSRFIPPPIPLQQTTDGLKVPERSNDGSSHKFPSLFAATMMKLDQLLPRSSKGFRSIPHDLYCPSIQKVLNDRVCKSCHQYFASLVMLKSHQAEHKQAALSVPKRVQPKRVAAKRQRELMVIIANEENGESVDWMDEEDVDLSGVAVPEFNSNRSGNLVPVISMRDHFSSPWEESVADSL